MRGSQFKLFFTSLCFLLTYFTIAQVKDTATVKDPTNKELSSQIQELTSKFDKANIKIVKIGLSVGYNNVFKNQQKNYQSASIDIKDTTLKLENMDRSSMKLSTSIIVLPFKKTDWIKKVQKRMSDKIDYFERINDTSLDKRIKEQVLHPDLKKKIIRTKYKKVTGRLGMRYAGSFFTTIIENVGIAININLIDFNKAQNEFAFNKNIEGGIGICYRFHDKVYLSYSNELYFARQLRESIKSHENEKLYVNGKLISSTSDLDVKDDNLFITRNVIASSLKVIIVF